jgi:hypothetical protein
LNRSFKPTPQIKDQPALLDVRLEGLQPEIMIDRVEKSLDVKVQYSVAFPATLQKQIYALVGRSARPIST